MTVWIVNSGIFKDFNSECGALSLSQLHSKVRTTNIDPDDIVLPGQGLSPHEIAGLNELASSVEDASPFRFWQGHKAPVPAPRALTHKHRLENSLISVPEADGSGNYHVELIISPSNELMQDHTTGQHLQGMVLIEACRQMFIAVSELSHMADCNGRKSYVVFNAMNIAFRAFTFPIPARIEYRQTSSTSARADRLTIGADLSVVQNEAVTMEVSVSYTLFRPEALKEKEIAMGRAALLAYAAAAAADTRQIAAE